MVTTVWAETSASQPPFTLQTLPGFFRFTFDNISMPENIEDTGLVGMNYLAELAPSIYGGVGGYGSVTGTQGGLFILGFEGGLHHEFARNWWLDAGLFVGGGGGRSSLVGGGLMLRPHVGIAYAWRGIRFGLNYSYVDFPDGKIQSKQIGIGLDVPFDFDYLTPSDHSLGCIYHDLSLFNLANSDFIAFHRNDFALLLQAYYQHSGTRNINGDVQDGRISLVGAEFDHYLSDNWFWWMKAAGAFHGIPNGYMDILGGFGYHWELGPYGIALVPQLGIGAGGGGMVDSGGGFLVNPALGLEWSLTRSFAARISSGYLWSPKGQFGAVPVTAEIIYHLDVASASKTPPTDLSGLYEVQGWRIELFNQTYLHPQRAYNAKTSAINLVALQIDQLFTNYFFLSYQAAFAYSGFHAGGYATGMIGAGLQTPHFFRDQFQLFTEFLVGAGGGGGLAIAGGALIEPVVGVRYSFTPTIGVQASVGQLKSWSDNLSTPAINVGLSIRFDTLNQI